jgi:hypothetical protein
MSVILRREQEERSCLSHVMCFSHSLIPIPLMSIPLIIILLNSHFFPQLIRVPIGIEDCRAPIMILDLQPQALCTGLYRHNPYLLRQGGRLRTNTIQYNTTNSAAASLFLSQTTTMQTSDFKSIDSIEKEAAIDNYGGNNPYATFKAEMSPRFVYVYGASPRYLHLLVAVLIPAFALYLLTKMLQGKSDETIHSVEEGLV